MGLNAPPPSALLQCLDPPHESLEITVSRVNFSWHRRSPSACPAPLGKGGGAPLNYQHSEPLNSMDCHPD